MKKITKWIFLFLLIGFPVGIYVFLQTFGDNKFEIPVFYEQGIDERVEGCENMVGQYFVPDYEIDRSIEEVLIYDIGMVSQSMRIDKSNHLTMLKEKISTLHNIRLVSLNSRSQELLNFARCGLNLKVLVGKDSLITNETLVLVDSKRRIRGYYDVVNREDMDRLTTELTILLSN